MKKIIAIFPIIVVLIMSNMVGLAVHAGLTSDEWVSNYASLVYDKEVGTLPIEEMGMSPDDFISDLGLSTDTKYVWIHRAVYTNDTKLYCYERAMFFPFEESDITEVGYNETDNYYYVSLHSASVGDNYYISQMRGSCLDGVYTMNDITYEEAYLANTNTYGHFRYYPDTERFEIYNSVNNDEPAISGTSFGIMSNVEDFYTDGLDLSVSFTPSLSGQVNRTINQNGVQAESDYFSMSITNNSTENAQFLMAIVPTGSSSNFVNNTADSVGVEFFPDKQIFTLMYKEWQYAPLITGTTVSKAFEKEYYQTSGWHIVSGNSTYTRQFNWKQINLQADTSYDVVVVAIPTEFSKPSIVFTQSDCEHYLDTSEGVEVYRSTFTVLNPAEYDSTCTDFGNVVGSTMVGESEKAEAYVDDNGEVVVDDVSASELLEDRGTWEPGIIENSVELFSLEGVQSLFDSCGNVINFIGYSFVFMPSWYWIILLFGITAVVAIGIIKALKG